MDRVMVDYYGVDTPLPNVANVNVVSGTTITVEPFEKAMLSENDPRLSTWLHAFEGVPHAYPRFP